jgi:hypothetical protein
MIGEMQLGQTRIRYTLLLLLHLSTFCEAAHFADAWDYHIICSFVVINNQQPPHQGTVSPRGVVICPSLHDMEVPLLLLSLS